MRGAALFLLLIAAFIEKRESYWINKYDAEFNFICPHGESMSYIRSKHHNYHEDRLWDIGCKKTFSSDCFWTPYVNHFDDPFTYTCPSNYVLTGIGSYHSNRHEDRRWRFHCCNGSGYSNANCYWTPYVNWFDEGFHWNVPLFNYLVGAESYHNNHHEDRRWRYKYCAKNG
ncbi:hemagglutinin/amebocyte aggregation factor [Misgurnus anguillicaudatus]|uniref:hemagglutinin/amebocyte aggregation factor n=1 Tax=Misgurnus anguillicaudatus TaxID=75329 RepID=UPI003CCF6D60